LHAISVVIAVVAISLPTRSASAQSGPLNTFDLGAYLAGKDLLVEGIVSNAPVGDRTMLGTCGYGPPMPLRVTDVTMTVSRVLAGVAEESTLVISMAGSTQYRTGQIVPGTHLLAWAYRECDDGWRLWGGACVITPSGYVVPPLPWEGKLTLGAGSSTTPITFAALATDLDARSQSMPMHAYTGTQAVGMVRVVRLTRDNGSVQADCDSIQWIMGSAPRMPTQIRWSPQKYCVAPVAAGDTLLAPVPAGSSASTLQLSSCPLALRVQHSFVPVLAVPLGFLNCALKDSLGSISARQYLSRE
jgi:hypothetical protein